MTCTHPDAQPLAPGGYACPIGQCRCCGHRFAYIDSGFVTGDYEEFTAHDPHLCEPCGGRPAVYRYGNRPEFKVSRGRSDTGGLVWETIPAGWEDHWDPGTTGQERPVRPRREPPPPEPPVPPHGRGPKGPLP